AVELVARQPVLEAPAGIEHGVRPKYAVERLTIAAAPLHVVLGRVPSRERLGTWAERKLLRGIDEVDHLGPLERARQVRLLHAQCHVLGAVLLAERAEFAEAPVHVPNTAGRADPKPHASLPTTTSFPGIG